MSKILRPNKQKKNLEKNTKNRIFFDFYRVESPASGKENNWFPDSPDFENLPDFGTGRDVLS